MLDADTDGERCAQLDRQIVLVWGSVVDSPLLENILKKDKDKDAKRTPGPTLNELCERMTDPFMTETVQRLAWTCSEETLNQTPASTPNPGFNAKTFSKEIPNNP